MLEVKVDASSCHELIPQESKKVPKSTSLLMKEKLNKSSTSKIIHAQLCEQFTARIE